MAIEYVKNLLGLNAHQNGTTAIISEGGKLWIDLYKDSEAKKLYLLVQPKPSGYDSVGNYPALSMGYGFGNTYVNKFPSSGAYIGSYLEIIPTYGQELILCGFDDTNLMQSFYVKVDGQTKAGNYRQYEYFNDDGLSKPIRTGFIPTNDNLWNAPPTISGSNTNVGQKTDPFTYAYTVGDINSTDNLTITEKANGVTIRTITNAVRGQTYTADLSSVWKQMPVNTPTTLTITVSDGSLSTTRTITFTRKEDRVVAYFKQASLTPESVQPEQVLIRVIRTIATNADFKVFVCNNGLDDSPTWEDATSAVLAGEAYTFTNRMKTAENYAVNVKIQVLKNTASAYSYIKALGFSYI